MLTQTEGRLSRLTDEQREPWGCPLSLCLHPSFLLFPFIRHPVGASKHEVAHSSAPKGPRSGGVAVMSVDGRRPAALQLGLKKCPQEDKAGRVVESGTGRRRHRRQKGRGSSTVTSKDIRRGGGYSVAERVLSIPQVLAPCPLLNLLLPLPRPGPLRPEADSLPLPWFPSGSSRPPPLGSSALVTGAGLRGLGVIWAQPPGSEPPPGAQPASGTTRPLLGQRGGRAGGEQGEGEEETRLLAPEAVNHLAGTPAAPRRGPAQHSSRGCPPSTPLLEMSVPEAGIGGALPAWEGGWGRGGSSEGGPGLLFQKPCAGEPGDSSLLQLMPSGVLGPEGPEQGAWRGCPGPKLAVRRYCQASVLGRHQGPAFGIRAPQGPSLPPPCPSRKLTENRPGCIWVKMLPFPTGALRMLHGKEAEHLGAQHGAGLWESLPCNLHQGPDLSHALSCKGVGTVDGGPDRGQEKALVRSLARTEGLTWLPWEGRGDGAHPRPLTPPSLGKSKGRTEWGFLALLEAGPPVGLHPPGGRGRARRDTPGRGMAVKGREAWVGFQKLTEGNKKDSPQYEDRREKMGGGGMLLQANSSQTSRGAGRARSYKSQGPFACCEALGWSFRPLEHHSHVKSGEAMGREGVSRPCPRPDPEARATSISSLSVTLPTPTPAPLPPVTSLAVRAPAKFSTLKDPHSVCFRLPGLRQHPGPRSFCALCQDCSAHLIPTHPSGLSAGPGLCPVLFTLRFSLRALGGEGGAVGEGPCQCWSPCKQVRDLTPMLAVHGLKNKRIAIRQIRVQTPALPLFQAWDQRGVPGHMLWSPDVRARPPPCAGPRPEPGTAGPGSSLAAAVLMWPADLAPHPSPQATAREQSGSQGEVPWRLQLDALCSPGSAGLAGRPDGTTQPAIKEIAGERHGWRPRQHALLPLKSPCSRGQHSQLELRTRRQAHQRSFNSCLMIAAHRQCVFAVITPSRKEKHKRLVDFGWGLTWAPGSAQAAPRALNQGHRLGRALLPADSSRLSSENHPRGTKRGTGFPIKSSSLLPPANRSLTTLVICLLSLQGNVGSGRPVHSGWGAGATSSVRGSLLPRLGLCGALRRGASAGLEPGTLAGVQVPPLRFSEMWTNYSPCAESRAALMEWGLHTEPHSAAFPPSPPRDPRGPLEGPLGTKNLRLQCPGLPVAASGDPALSWDGEGVRSAGRRQPVVTATTTKTVLLPLKFLERLAGRHELLFQRKGPPAPRLEISKEEKTASPQEGGQRDSRAVKIQAGLGYRGRGRSARTTQTLAGRLKCLSGRLRPRDPNRGFWMKKTFRSFYQMAPRNNVLYLWKACSEPLLCHVCTTARPSGRHLPPKEAGSASQGLTACKTQGQGSNPSLSGRSPKDIQDLLGEAAPLKAQSDTVGQIIPAEMRRMPCHPALRGGAPVMIRKQEEVFAEVSKGRGSRFGIGWLELALIVRSRPGPGETRGGVVSDPDWRAGECVCGIRTLDWFHMKGVLTLSGNCLTLGDAGSPGPWAYLGSPCSSSVFRMVVRFACSAEAAPCLPASSQRQSSGSWARTSSGHFLYAGLKESQRGALLRCFSKYLTARRPKSQVGADHQRRAQPDGVRVWMDPPLCCSGRGGGSVPCLPAWDGQSFRAPECFFAVEDPCCAQGHLDITVLNPHVVPVRQAWNLPFTGEERGYGSEGLSNPPRVTQ
ncbi:hypothetical protein Cadr_000026336 [Camelus dromedarius]|uniref:Uncharacterized protein n=1 Tax=Camelus dromedarius TaxID=9838 RepID=A0A5N4CEF1_CAMDR|nr:hypothetical protein Cadr_000026336 [Camelus dromedarius]